MLNFRLVCAIIFRHMLKTSIAPHSIPHLLRMRAIVGRRRLLIALLGQL